MLERTVRAAGPEPLSAPPEMGADEVGEVEELMPAVGVVGSPISPCVLKSGYSLLSGLDCSLMKV